MDGIDAAVVEVGGRQPVFRIRELAALTRPYPPRLHQRLLKAAEAGEYTAADLARLSADVARVLARAASSVIRAAGLVAGDIDAVASHGQTIAHLPGPRTTTVQVGEPAVIAESTGITVVSDFRAADTAAGGQGAPLVPWAHHLMFAERSRNLAVVNVGGMANVTVLEAGRGPDRVTGGDSGPGNLLIDAAVVRMTGGRRSMDRGGRMAAGYRPDDRLVASVLESPFFRARGRRSTGREDFGRPMVERLLSAARRHRLGDGVVLASLVMASARSIAMDCRRFSQQTLDEVLVCGGGALNRTLMAMLGSELDGPEVKTTAERGIDPRFVEADAFAVLGHLALKGLPANVAGITGAAGARVLGKISPGPNYLGTRLGRSV